MKTSPSTGRASLQSQHPALARGHLSVVRDSSVFCSPQVFYWKVVDDAYSMLCDFQRQLLAGQRLPSDAIRLIQQLSSLLVWLQPLLDDAPPSRGHEPSDPPP